MNGPAVLVLLAFVTALTVTALLVAGDLLREALDEHDARQEWRRIVDLSEKRRHLSNTSPRSLP